MVTFTKSDMQRFMVSGVAALAMSATCLFAAVGPARANVPAAAQQVAQIAVR
ncbi:hypothetical protein ACSBM8_05715 [Sphingomonas sp. ASY06-1R]|jgi:hypothetical protein|uniref:hypothetical protein n=1 Tax=Sphingomonas sp. ASY06-1R TaxID=3445771 RepID=UPI003FA2E6D2